MNQIVLSLFLGVLATSARAECNGVMYQCDQAGSRVRIDVIASGTQTSRTDELKDLRPSPRPEYATCSVGHDSGGCRPRQAALQKQLNELYGKEERAVLSSLKDYEPEFKDEVVRSLRDKYTALASYKDAECLSDPLVDGMSLRDAGVIADECKVKWRLRHIGDMKKRFRRKVP